MVVNVILEKTQVDSFNGRTGAVVPTSGDYTAAMVGAVTSSQVDSKITTAFNGKIKYGTTDIGVGAALETGAIYLVYQN